MVGRAQSESITIADKLQGIGGSPAGSGPGFARFPTIGSSSIIPEGASQRRTPSETGPVQDPLPAHSGKKFGLCRGAEPGTWFTLRAAPSAWRAGTASVTDLRSQGKYVMGGKSQGFTPRKGTPPDRRGGALVMDRGLPARLGHRHPVGGHVVPSAEPAPRHSSRAPRLPCARSLKLSGTARFRSQSMLDPFYRRSSPIAAIEPLKEAPSWIATGRRPLLPLPCSCLSSLKRRPVRAHTSD